MEPQRQDRRGTPPGTGTVKPDHGGLIGNPPFAEKPGDRERVKLYARVMSQEMIASSFDPPIDVRTLQRHFRRELDEGKREAVAAVGGKLLQKALAGDKACMIFYLKTQGKWNQRIEVTGADGGAINHAHILVHLDKLMEKMSDEQLAALDPFLAELFAALGVDDEPDVGPGGAGSGPGGEATTGA